MTARLRCSTVVMKSNWQMLTSLHSLPRCARQLRFGCTGKLALTNSALEALTECFCKRNGRVRALAGHQRAVNDHVWFPVGLAGVPGATPLEFVLERKEQMVRQFELAVFVILEACEIHSCDQVLTITLLNIAQNRRGMADHSNWPVAVVKVADQLNHVGIRRQIP